jgi:hypothetical protein
VADLRLDRIAWETGHDSVGSLDSTADLLPIGPRRGGALLALHLISAQRRPPPIASKTINAMTSANASSSAGAAATRRRRDARAMAFVRFTAHGVSSRPPGAARPGRNGYGPSRWNYSLSAWVGSSVLAIVGMSIRERVAHRATDAEPWQGAAVVLSVRPRRHDGPCGKSGRIVSWARPDIKDPRWRARTRCGVGL